METRKVAAVFGGSGFIGRYVVKRLAADGYVVRVPVRNPEGARFLMTAGMVGQIVPLYANLSDPPTIDRGVEQAEVVVNLIGILAERARGDFERVQAEGAGRIAAAARRAGVRRLVHMSAIGARPDSPSRYGTSKARGEALAQAAFPGVTVLRPSIVFGPEDAFFNRFARIAQLSPVMPVIRGATRFQPVYVGDVADAVHAALTTDTHEGRTYELGGPDVTTFRDLLRYILAVTGHQRRLLAIPDPVARLQASVAEHLPGRPFTRDQLAMLGSDNVVAPGALGFAAFGISPTSYDLVVPSYLRRYRPGGGE